MPFYSSTIILFLLQTVTSLVAVDLQDYNEHDGVLPELVPNDASGNSMFDAPNYSPSLAPDAKLLPNHAFKSSLPLAAGLTTSSQDTSGNDVRTSGSADETLDGAMVSNPGNHPVPDSMSAECDSNTPPNARMRMRRDDDDSCTIQQSRDTRRINPETDRTQNGAGQNSGQGPGEEQDNRVNLELYLPIFDPSPDYKWPVENLEVCPHQYFGFSNIPMCDSGYDAYTRSYTIGLRRYFDLRHAHPCTFTFKQRALPTQCGGHVLFREVSEEERKRILCF